MLRCASVVCLACAMVVALPGASVSQGTRASALLGGTWLDFGSPLGSSPGATAQLRVQQSAVEISAFAIAMFGGASVVSDCPPSVSCFSYSTPNALFGALLSLVSPPSSTGWRGTIGGGLLGTSGMEYPGDHSSPLAALGLDWAPPRRTGLTLTFGVRAVALTSRVGGLRYLVLPALGISF